MVVVGGIKISMWWEALYTKSNFLHWQLEGANGPGMRHKITYHAFLLAILDLSIVWRFVSSLRSSLTPQDGEFYEKCLAESRTTTFEVHDKYNLNGVITAYNKGEKPTANDSNGAATITTKLSVKPKAKKSSCSWPRSSFPNLPLTFEGPLRTVYSPVKYISTGVPAWVNYTQPQLVLALLEKGKLIRIIHKREKEGANGKLEYENYPVDVLVLGANGKPLLPCDVLTASVVAEKLQINISKQRH
jgi:hypothetical protein